MNYDKLARRLHKIANVLETVSSLQREIEDQRNKNNMLAVKVNEQTGIITRLQAQLDKTEGR